MEFNVKWKSNYKWIHASFMDIVVWSRTLGLGKTNLNFQNDFICFYFYPLHSFNNLASVISGLFYSPNENLIHLLLRRILISSNRSISLAGFLSIIGFALIRDVNLLNEFEFIYNNNSLSE